MRPLLVWLAWLLGQADRIVGYILLSIVVLTVVSVLLAALYHFWR